MDSGVAVLAVAATPFSDMHHSVVDYVNQYKIR